MHDGTCPVVVSPIRTCWPPESVPGDNLDKKFQLSRARCRAMAPSAGSVHPPRGRAWRPRVARLLDLGSQIQQVPGFFGDQVAARSGLVKLP